MKHTRIAVAIVALAMVPSSGILGGGGALRPRAAAAGPWGPARAMASTPVATLNGKAKRDLGMAVFLSPSGLGALLESQPRTLESRAQEWLVPTPITAAER